MQTWIYPVAVRQEADGRLHVYSDDLPEAIASGADETEALDEMRQALVAAVRGRMKDGTDLDPPAAADSLHRVALPVPIAAKATVYVAWQRSNISKSALAERLGRSESEVRRILDPDHGTKLDQLADAARALGGNMIIGFEAR
jgi:antitoxin HicB